MKMPARTTSDRPAPAAARIAARLAKSWSASWPASAGLAPVRGSFPNRAETKIQPPDSTACGTGPVWWGASAVSIIFTAPVSAFWVVGRGKDDQDGQVLADVEEVVVPASVHRDDVARAGVDDLAFDFELGPPVLDDVDLVRAVRVLGILATGGQQVQAHREPGAPEGFPVGGGWGALRGLHRVERERLVTG